MSHQLPPFFHEIFDPSLPRLGPGDDASTVRALDMAFAQLRRRPVPLDSGHLRILDIGCGTGAQTIQLAKYTGETVMAVDNHQPYLDELARRAAAEGVSGRILPRIGDMHALGMDSEFFDIVWAEGCLFVMGFSDGLAACHDLLVQGGILGASEMVWLRDDPPKECRDYFGETYPALTGIEPNLETIRRAGFEVAGHFILPDSSWLIPFYEPLEKRLESLRPECAGDEEKLGLIDAIHYEIDIFRKYSAYFGYMFSVMQRR